MMEIISRKDMVSVFELKKAQYNVHWIIKHFLYEYDEVLYFVEDGFLRAVVSVGDIFKYLGGDKSDILNRDFTQIPENDLSDTREFFLRHPTIHELPLMDLSGGFVGIVKSGYRNPERLWTEFRLRIKGLYYGLELYYDKSAEKFMEHFKGKVFLVDLPNDSQVLKRLSHEDEKEKFRKKHIIPPLDQLRSMTEQEERDYWGADYEPGISKRFADEFSSVKVWEQNGCKYYENTEISHYITFDKGKRNVVNKNLKARRNIYLVGPCTVFGAYVTDEQTLEYYLQQLINDDSLSFQVINFGALGLYSEFQYLLTEHLGDEDIVILASQSKKLTAIMERYDSSCYLGDYSDIFDRVENPLVCVLDTFRHINYKITEKIAGRIYDSIKPYLTLCSTKIGLGGVDAVQDYFIPWDVITYYKEFSLNYGLNELEGRVGAIVMNCNPFTKGHRYLIEYAAERADTLIIFVVEEDASEFPFDDRIKMVELGTEDMANVKVVPSGKYNISKSTFAQYFEKDKKIDKIDSMEYDLRIFGEVIADCMNISCRFVGEEPTDMVTRQYNETMKRLLPQYGIEFIEIPRLKAGGETYVSASKVRRDLKEKNWNEVSDLVPETTIKYLKAKYQQ